MESGELGTGAGLDGPALTMRAGPGVREHVTDTDSALVDRTLRGDRAAFGDLYREYGAMVHGLLLARVPRREAEDLTQEVFLVAWRRLGELREGAAVGAWLVSISRSRAADWARADSRRRGREAGRGREMGGGGPARTTKGLDSAARAEAVLAAIRGLPEAYREPLVLRLVAGLTGPQIACCLGMTHGSVRVNLHRGMAMLREKLSEGTR